MLHASYPSAGKVPLVQFNDYYVGFDASWELDLWGRVHRPLEAADAQVTQAAEERRETSSRVSRKWPATTFQLRGVQMPIRIAVENLTLAEDVLARAREYSNAVSLRLDQPPGALRSILGVQIGAPGAAAGAARIRACSSTTGHSCSGGVQLNGTVGLDSIGIGKLLQAKSLQYMAGPSITVPIFTGGRLKNTLELRKAQQVEAAIAYQKTVTWA